MFTLSFFLIAIDLFGAFFSLIAILGILIGKPVDKKGARLQIALIVCLMLLLTSDVIIRMSAGDGPVQNVLLIRIATYFKYVLGFLSMPLAAEFVTYLIESRSGIKGILWKYVEWTFFGIGVVMMTVNLFNGFLYSIDGEGTFHLHPWGVLPGAVSMIGLVITVGVVVRFIQFLVKFEKVAFITYLLLPFLALGYNLMQTKVSLLMPAITLSVLVLYLSYEFNTREYRIELERDLADRQIAMFCHQIQPHFIFNSLALIKYQCRTSPESAIETIDEFSDYLRGSTDMMSSMDCVGADRELDLVRHYIGLQKKRFEEIDYRVQIEDTDFLIPPFTIQTCVENAITHGLRAQTGPDPYISVKTFKKREKHVIEIEDNGCGFNVSDFQHSSDPGHVGLMNTGERLRLMCGGSLKIESEPGKGTKIIVVIPEHRSQSS